MAAGRDPIADQVFGAGAAVAAKDTLDVLVRTRDDVHGDQLLSAIGHDPYLHSRDAFSGNATPLP